MITMTLVLTDKNELIIQNPTTKEVTKEKINEEKINLYKKVFNNEVVINLFAKEICDNRIGTITVRKI